MMSSAETLKVLLVEDNPGDARLVKFMLLDQPPCRVRIVEADSLASARTAIVNDTGDEKIDVVLLDLSLPDASGLDTLHEMQEASQIPIIVLTGLEDEEVALDAVYQGAQDYLVKGRDDADQILRAIRYAIERRKADMERLEYVEHLHQALIETVKAISFTLEKRDPYTAGHQHRVAQLARAIGQEMGMDEHQLEGLYFGGLIHDIGKVAVPGELLSRPGKLTHLEKELIKTHAELGHDIIKDVEFPWPIDDMVSQHHEKLDGSGYPKGLKDGQIILEARILTVADVVEAMSSHRPYRPSLGLDEALAEVAGHEELYDADIVRTCQHLFKDKGFHFGKD